MLRQRKPNSRKTLPQEEHDTVPILTFTNEEPGRANEESNSDSDESVQEGGDDVRPNTRRSGSTVTHIQSPVQHNGFSWSRVYTGLFLLLVILLLVYLGISFATTIFGAIHSQKPYTDLLSFATREAQEKKLDNVEDLPVDDLNIFVQSVCMADDTPERVRNGLRIQLRGVPGNVVEDLVKRAVIDKMSTASSTQDSKGPISDSGKIHSYMSFWSTAYNGETTMAEKYTTCIMVSGISLSVGETPAEIKTTEEYRVVGSKPCECGFVFCERCPVFEKFTAKVPIFKRHVLTMKQQIELHNWMVKQATDQAIALVGNRNNIFNRISERVNERNDELKSLSWKAPEKYLFMGKD